MKNQVKITFNKILPVSVQRSLFLEEALSAPCQHKPSSYLFFAFHRWPKVLKLLWLASLSYRVLISTVWFLWPIYVVVMVSKSLLRLWELRKKRSI